MPKINYIFKNLYLQIKCIFIDSIPQVLTGVTKMFCTYYKIQVAINVNRQILHIITFFKFLFKWH